MNVADDPITTAPTIEDTHGKAWAVDIDRCYRELNTERAAGADLGSWLVEAPWAHPFWHSYWINLIHLRPIPAITREVRVYLEGATHEIWVMALDPDAPRQPQLDSGRMQTLQPINFSAQFIEPTDADALKRVEDAVREICAGRLSPDTDFIHAWGAKFGRNMLRDSMLGQDTAVQG